MYTSVHVSGAILRGDGGNQKIAWSTLFTVKIQTWFQQGVKNGQNVITKIIQYFQVSYIYLHIK